jgi:hypothetical protein
MEAKMTRVSVAAFSGLFVLMMVPAKADLAGQVRDLELKGEARAARQVLEQAVKASPNDAGVWVQWAEFLDQRRDPQAREAYAKAIGLATGTTRRDLARRLAALDLLAGDQTAAQQHITIAMESGATGLQIGAGSTAFVKVQMGVVEIPGPLRSFSRMAALAPDVAPGEVLSALARNVMTNGYQATSGSESLEPTEYLKLVFRYLSQARELDRLSGANKTIRIENCDSTQTGDLLKVLGFRMRGACGAEVVLETVNASRAFLTMDSGFPVADLEQALRTNRPFVYDYHPAKVAVLYAPEYWLSAREKQGGEFIDSFLSDPGLCRLYLGMFKLDPVTADEVRRALSVQRIRAFAHVFDFFGGMFKVRDGKAIVPGGQKSAAAWGELAGVSPDQGVLFYERLVVKDDGWLASYFDALSRIHGPVLDYLAEPARLKRFYSALRGRITSPGPARPVFRANADLMLLTSRMRLDANGRPRIPGGIDVWRGLFVSHPQGKYDGKLTKLATTWKDPDDLIEALFALSRKAVDNEPLKIYLAISDLERRRATPLETATVERLARDYRQYGAQYAVLNETPALSDKTIIQFMDLANLISLMKDSSPKANGAGIVQALMGLWQVMVRQKLVPESEADATLSALLAPFPKVKSERELFEAGQAGVMTILKATGAPAGVNPQDRMLDLLSGAVNPEDQESHSLVITEMMKGFEAQKLVSLKTLFDLAGQLDAAARGEKLNAALVNRLAARVSDLNLPRTSLSTQERNTLSYGYWTERHIDAERKLNLRAVVDKAAGQPERLKDALGLLTPSLRDTLVGLLYLHYAPPGAQILYTNPLFARSHDFIGIQGASQTWKSTEVLGSGWPASAGGRLVGSLANLPYALAEAEQNFLIPTREQALIWGDLVPQVLVSAKVSRWWNVTPGQMHWVSLHMQLGEALVAESAINPAVRQQTLAWLDNMAPPQRSRRVDDLLASGNAKEAIDEVTPQEHYFIGVQAVAVNLDAAAGLTTKIRSMSSADPKMLNYAAVSEAFGTPKPTLANSHHPQLLNPRTFPTMMGYSSRIMAESWESNNLYFAGLADELYIQPSQLNYLIPEWTQKTVEQIFATHLEDWPAMLRSMKIVADGVRVQNKKLAGLEQKAALQ